MQGGLTAWGTVGQENIRLHPGGNGRASSLVSYSECLFCSEHRVYTTVSDQRYGRVFHPFGYNYALRFQK
jgi:hypothetical protein